jgi:dephospho-CoA kinase
MTVIGLTGGVGTGKSTSARLLQQRLIPVVDTDQLARQVVALGEPALQEVAAAFGPGVIGAEGRLRRDELARIVFADPAKRQRLEAILHPRIRQRWQQQVEQWKQQRHARCVVVIPLLYETAAAAHFDTVICVACSSATQRQRLQSRGWTGEQIDQRLAAQWPVQKKMDLANYVVWTEAGLDTHAAQLERIIKV